VPRKLYTGIVPASGTQTLSVTPLDSIGWRVTQVSPSMLAGSAPTVSPTATAAVYVAGISIAPYVAQGDAVGGDPPIDLQPGDVMTLVWVGATAGNVVQAYVFYDYIPSGPPGR
jgi:hypothetical protein